MKKTETGYGRVQLEHNAIEHISGTEPRDPGPTPLEPRTLQSQWVQLRQETSMSVSVSVPVSESKSCADAAPEANESVSVSVLGLCLCLCLWLWLWLCVSPYLCLRPCL